MEDYRRDSCIRGYHVYKSVWDANVGEILQCKRERQNSEDKYAVAVLKSGMIVGHLPRKVSRISSLFLKRGGTIECTVTASRRYSVDLPQGGLEIPCCLLFRGKLVDIEKLKRLCIDI